MTETGTVTGRERVSESAREREEAREIDRNINHVLYKEEFIQIRKRRRTNKLKNNIYVFILFTIQLVTLRESKNN